MHSLSEMLDALELGLIELRKERDELREMVGRTDPKAEPKAQKPAAAKAASRARPALGRTLNQIRKGNPSAS